MNEKTKLTLSMGIFYLIVILFFGLIIIYEKKAVYITPKIKEKMLTYLEEKCSLEERQFFKYQKIISNKNTYSMKVYHKNNKHLYFTVTYKKKKITDTYKKDYLEGKTLNTYMQKIMNKDLKEKLKNHQKINITYNTKLNHCTEEVKKELLKENKNLPIYTVNIDEEIKDITTIKMTLKTIHQNIEKLNLTPKNYHITLTNKTNITKSLNIIIEPTTIENNLDEVILLIENNDLNSLKKYNVECTNLN